MTNGFNHAEGIGHQSDSGVHKNFNCISSGETNTWDQPFSHFVATSQLLVPQILANASSLFRSFYKFPFYPFLINDIKQLSIQVVFVFILFFFYSPILCQDTSKVIKEKEL